MITVTTPAASSKLTTVDNVRAEFPAITTGVADDTLLGRWIDRASAMAVEYCNRPFAEETVREYLFPSFSTRVIAPERYPITDLTVTENDTALVDGTDYLLDATEHVIYRLKGGRPCAWGCRIQLDYTAGYVTPDQASPTLPGDVEYAVQLWVASFVASQSSATSSTGAGGLKREVIEGVGTFEYFQETTSSGSTETSVSADRPSPESLLAPYRRIAL